MNAATLISDGTPTVVRLAVARPAARGHDGLDLAREIGGRERRLRRDVRRLALAADRGDGAKQEVERRACRARDRRSLLSCHARQVPRPGANQASGSPVAARAP